MNSNDVDGFILKKIFAWHWADRNRLGELIAFADILGLGDISGDVDEFIEGSGQDRIDINAWMFGYMDKIVLELLKEAYDEDTAYELIGHFNPIVDGMNSLFQIECLDNLAWDSLDRRYGEWKTIRKQAINCIRNWSKNKI